MKKLLCLFFAVAIILAGCGSMVDSIPTTESASSSEETSAELPTENTEEIVTQEATEVEPQPLEITYEEAFNFVKKCEDNIIESNKYDFNKYNESAAEKIIYSAEYATLYCSYWKALEILDDGNDSRFEKSKMRWQIDYSSEEWTDLLINALETGGTSGFQDEYARLYTEEVFPKVEYRWENGID